MRKGEKRKKELLNIAYDMFLTRGYENTHVDEIIERHDDWKWDRKGKSDYQNGYSSTAKDSRDSCIDETYWRGTTRKECSFSAKKRVNAL